MQGNYLVELVHKPKVYTGGYVSLSLREIHKPLRKRAGCHAGRRDRSGVPSEDIRDRVQAARSHKGTNHSTLLTAQEAFDR